MKIISVKAIYQNMFSTAKTFIKGFKKKKTGKTTYEVVMPPQKSNINLIEPPNLPLYCKFRGQKSMLNDTTRVPSTNPDE